MTVKFPRDLVFEMYLGRWVEVTALPEARGLRQVEPVTVTWGAPNEQAKALAPPSTMEAVLNNTGGHWTPGNPMSDYYNYLQGRNVPTRLGLRISRDTFSRTLPSTWQSADTGEGWSTAGVNDSYSVGGGLGVHSVSAVSSFALTFIGDSYTDCQIAASCPATSVANVTGGPIEPLNLVLRYQSAGAFIGEHYMMRVSIDTAEVLTVAIWHSSLGVLSSVTSFGVISPAGPALRAKFQAEGQTLRAKLYAVGPVGDPDANEPLDWLLSVHHERLAAGFPGIRTGVAAGNTNIPVTASYDDWVLTLMRHTGELARLQPTWDESHRIKKAAVKAADITQRLGRPQRPDLSSAPRRYLAVNSEFTTTDHWPLDESVAGSPPGSNTVPGGAPARFERETSVVPNRGAVEWGQTDKLHTAVPGFVDLSNGGRLKMSVNSAPLGSAFSLMWAMKLSPDAGMQLFIGTPGVFSRWGVTFYTDGTYEVFSNPSGTSIGSGVFAPNGLKDFWGTFGVTMFNNGGANVGFHYNVNGTTLGVGSFGGDAAYVAPDELTFHVPQPITGGQGGSAMSSAFLTATRFDTSVGGLSVGFRAHRALLGWRGEAAGLRAFRLAVEEGVPFDYWGDLSQTRAMGPQRPIPLLDQFSEAAELDGAWVYAPRYTAGIAFRGRRSMTGRAVDATLSYSAGHVAPEFATSADDRPTANLVRAERVNGGSFILEQTTGPMNTGVPGSSPDAVGRTPAEEKVNTDADAQLPDVAGWARALGTVPEIRFPKVTVNLAAREIVPGGATTVPRQILNLRPGDRLAITGMTAADVYRELDQMVRGGVEVLRHIRGHKATFNTAPYEVWRSLAYGDAAARYDGAVTTLDAQLTSGTTGARNVTTSAGPVWTVVAGMYPLNVWVGGELCTVSGVTGAGPGQSMTISVRNLNSLPVAGGKTWPAGTSVRLALPVYYC